MAVESSLQPAVMACNCSEDDEVIRVSKWLKDNRYGKLCVAFDWLLAFYSQSLQTQI